MLVVLAMTYGKQNPLFNHTNMQRLLHVKYKKVTLLSNAPSAFTISR